MTDEQDETQVTTDTTPPRYVDPNSGAAPQPGGLVYGGEPAPIPEPDDEEIDPTGPSFGTGKDMANQAALFNQASGALTPGGTVGTGASDAQPGSEDDEDPNPDQGDDDVPAPTPSADGGAADAELFNQAGGERTVDGSQDAQTSSDDDSDGSNDSDDEATEETEVDGNYDDKEVWSYKDLQEQLSTRGLSAQGSRAELVERLREDDKTKK